LGYGLVNRVVADEELQSVTRQIASRLASWPPRAIALTKRALSHAWTAGLEAKNLVLAPLSALADKQFLP